MAARHIPALPDESALDLNAAIHATEQEIMSDAMGNDPMDNDGDTSLEEMDEYADGEDTDEGDREDEEQQRAAGQGEGEEGEQAGEEGEGEGEPQQAQQDVRDQDGRGRQPGVPPHRLRETTERLRQVEAERDHLARTREMERNEVRELNMRVDNLMAQLAARGAPQPQGGVAGTPPQNQQTAPPDMFADPQGYQRWVDNRIEERAREIAGTTVNATLQQHQLERVNVSLEQAARGPRAFEFQAAYGAITSLNPRDPQNQRLVQGILRSPDPAAALWDWWEGNGGPEYRAQVYDQLSQNFAPQQRGNGNGRPNQQGGNGQRPRTEFRGPVTARGNPPSLNSMAGHGGGQRGIDPRSLDGSDRSTFDYAFDDRR